MTFDRRKFMCGSIAALGASVAVGSALADETVGLRDYGAAKGILFGSSASLRFLRSSNAAQALAVQEAALMVPEYEIKWGHVEKSEGRPDYSDGDLIVDFARSNGLKVRGHTAIWHKNLPRWAAERLAGGDVELIAQRVQGALGHYRGRADYWDVVNEAIEPEDGNNGMMRSSPLLSASSDFVALSFENARAADPKAQLFYNDYGVEHEGEDTERKRRGVLALLEDLRRRDIPIDGFGVQSHLIGGRTFNAAKFRRFLAEVASLGLTIHLTELDVNDQRLPRNTASRDAAVADLVREYLDTALDERAVVSVATWGLSDARTWLNTDRPRSDGEPQRPLPFDRSLRKKPMWQAIASSLEAAPRR